MDFLLIGGKYFLETTLHSHSKLYAHLGAREDRQEDRIFHFGAKGNHYDTIGMNSLDELPKRHIYHGEVIHF